MPIPIILLALAALGLTADRINHRDAFRLKHERWVLASFPGSAPLSSREIWAACLDGTVACQITPEIEKEQRAEILRGENAMGYGEKKARERANLVKLPPLGYANHPETGQVVAIKRGERGYFPIQTNMTAAQLNAKERVTEAQAAALLAGSLYGWSSPHADVDQSDLAKAGL